MVKVRVDPTFHLVKTREQESDERYLEYRKKWTENPEKYIVGDFPIHLDLETHTSCNLKCFMCIQSYDPPKPARMDTELYKKIIDEGVEKGLCSIKTQYRGEPLLDKRMPELVKYAKDAGIIEVMFNTNATLLDEDMARALIDAGLDKLICSVDGYEKEVYENVRIGGTFEKVLSNIKNFQRIKEEMGLKKPIVRVQMVDTPRNHHQIDDFMDFWGRIAEHVAVEDMLDWGMKEEYDVPMEDFACAQLWQRLIVMADGDVMPCCRSLRDGNEKLAVLGNANTQTIEEIWKGDQLNSFRELHRNGESHKMRVCRFCGLRKSLNEKRKTQ